MRRRDVVAPRGKDHQRIADPPQVGDATLADADLALFQLVADEQVLDDRDDLLAAEEIEPAPPAFELQESFALAVDLVEEPRIFLPDRLFGLEIGEVLHQPRAIEPAAAKV